MVGLSIPSQKQQVEQLFKTWSGFYDHPLLQKGFYGRVHQALLCYAQNLQSGSVLDVGCGTGELLHKLAKQYPHSSLVGLDLSPEMLKVAAAKDYLGADVELMQGSAYGLPWAAPQFDLITNTISSHFYLELDRAFAEFYRVLNSGGTLMIASMSNGVLAKLPGSLGRELRMPQVVYRSQSQQTRLLKQAGFRVRQVERLPLGTRLYIASKP